MHHSPTSQSDLPLVVDLMRNLSRLTDPQAASALYGDGLRKLNLVPHDRYLSISRRDLQSPHYRITRCSSWPQQPNPWKERHKLPLLSGGLLADILYSNEPAIIHDIGSKVDPADPAFQYLQDMRLLVALPHFDNGESINVGIILAQDPASVPLDLIPMMVWQANLWGRATLNLVTQQKLQLAHDAMDRELKVVAEIQKSLLPRALPSIKNAQLAVHYQSSQRAGGDYYDFFPLPNDRWGILLADVSGHGTPAAVLMAITHAIAHSHPADPMPPETLLAYVNEKLARLYTTDNGNFVTAFYAVYAPPTPDAPASLTYSSAGHPPPRLLRNHQVLSLDGESSYPLGIFPNDRYLAHHLQLLPGDQLLFYTDGIPEAFNPQGDPFTTARLDAAAQSACGHGPDRLLSHILKKLTHFTHPTPPADDQTLLTMQIL